MINAKLHDFDRDHQVYKAKNIYLSSSLHKMFVNPEVLYYSTHNPWEAVSTDAFWKSGIFVRSKNQREMAWKYN